MLPCLGGGQDISSNQWLISSSNGTYKHSLYNIQSPWMRFFSWESDCYAWLWFAWTGLCTTNGPRESYLAASISMNKLSTFGRLSYFLLEEAEPLASELDYSESDDSFGDSPAFAGSLEMPRALRIWNSSSCPFAPYLRSFLRYFCACERAWASVRVRTYRATLLHFRPNLSRAVLNRMCSSSCQRPLFSIWGPPLLSLLVSGTVAFGFSVGVDTT
jgi:hypothetical protein